MAARSSGTRVRGSITSASMPSSASRSAAASASWTRRDSATIVTSLPRRSVTASPIRTGSILSGIRSLRKYNVLFSTNTTGFGSARARARRPAASTARLGITTLRPGTCVSQLSRLCECWAAPRCPAPPCVRSTSGTVSWPADMKCAFAALFTTWSSASVMKSMNMISSTGRMPDWAAPIATPVIAASLIGVSITRSAPNSSARPAVAVYGPPSATSSPRTRRARPRALPRQAWS